MDTENNRSLVGVTVRNMAGLGLTENTLKFIVVFVYYLVNTVCECPSLKVQPKRATFR